MRMRLSVALPLWLAKREGMTSQSGWVRHCSPAPLNTLLPRVKCLTRLFGPRGTSGTSTASYGEMRPADTVFPSTPQAKTAERCCRLWCEAL